MTSLRRRLGRWLLGYEPTPLLKEDGTYIVIRQGEFTFSIAASSLNLTMETPAITPRRTSNLTMETPAPLVWDDPLEMLVPSRPTGTFSGTIGQK